MGNWDVLEREPGYSTSRLFDALDDVQADHLLPPGAFTLLSVLAPERLRGTERANTLASLLSVGLAIDDPARRGVLLKALPASKVEELERRTQQRARDLQNSERLAPGVRKAMAGFFGEVAATDQEGTCASAHTPVRGYRELFPHQKRVASEVERYLYLEDGRVMMHLPTGVGKTRTAMSVVASHLRCRSGVVLWLAATQELLDQAVDEFLSTWQGVGDRTVECVRFWRSYAPDLTRVVDGLVVAGLDKLRSYGKSREDLWSLGDRTTMVIFDEAHQAAAPTYRDLVDSIVTRNPKTPLLGLTATPGRTWDSPDVDDRLSELFFRNKVTLDYAGDGNNPIVRLTEDGYLADVEFRLLNVEPGLQLSESDLRHLATSLEIPDKIVELLGADERRNLRIVETILELAKSHRRVLVFAPSVANAMLLAGVCRAMGFEADAVTAKTDATFREQVLRRFKRHDRSVRILLNFGVLTTGFDAPNASAAVIARPTKSLVLYSQMVGRVIRGPKAGGTHCCEIVTVVDTNLPGFGDVAEAFANWEDVWI